MKMNMLTTYNKQPTNQPTNQLYLPLLMSTYPLHKLINKLNQTLLPPLPHHPLPLQPRHAPQRVGQHLRPHKITLPSQRIQHPYHHLPPILCLHTNVQLSDSLYKRAAVLRVCGLNLRTKLARNQMYNVSVGMLQSGVRPEHCR